MRIPLRSILVVVAVVASGACSPAGDTPRAIYDAQTGRLQRLEFDVTANGRNDAVSVMDGTRIERIELDLDEDGRTDRWDFYNADRSLAKVGLSSRNDGVMDVQAFYDAKGGVRRIEVDTQRTGRFDRVEFYRDGLLVSSEEDTSGDGRPDTWTTYRANPNPPSGQPPYAIATVAYERSGRGTPERRDYYDAGGALTRVEVDPDGDGVFQTIR